MWGARIPACEGMTRERGDDRCVWADYRSGALIFSAPPFAVLWFLSYSRRPAARRGWTGGVSGWTED